MEAADVILLVVDVQEGKAAYYADSLHGNKTASGEVYRKDELTAAHRGNERDDPHEQDEHRPDVAEEDLMEGLEPVMQLQARDRSRVVLESDAIGAAGLGIPNILCLTGDDVSNGDQPQAKRVFDFDSIQLLQTARIMRDKGVFLSGRKISKRPEIFLGAAANPFAPPFDWRPGRLAKKIEAGADFIQTQYCFDVPRFRKYMRQVRDLGLHKLAYILVGVGPLRSAKAAEFMRTKIPGVVIPDEIVERLRKTPKERQQEEGRKICIEIIQQVRKIEGVSGVHIMAYRQEELVANIVLEAGLLPRPI